MRTKSETPNSLADNVSTPTVKLNNGVEMPVLGFGVFQVPDLNECERENFNIFDFNLSDEDMEVIQTLDKR